MDKHNQISIKINGKEPKVEKEKKDKTTEFVESEKPLIIIENEEVAAAKEEEDDDFSWVLPDETLTHHSSKDRKIPIIPIEDVRTTKGSSKIKHFPKKPKGFQLFSLKQIIVSFSLAIVLGTGFGIMILKVVGDVNSQPAGMEAPSQPVNQNPTPAPKGDNPPAENPVAIELESLSTGIVQGGKFSTADAASTIVGDIKGKGFAATTVELDGAFFVLAGIGLEQGAVGGMKTAYEGAFPEFFTKTIEVQGGSFSNAGKADSEAIKVSIPAFKELLALSSQAFGTAEITDEQWGNLSKLFGGVKEVKKDGLHAELKDFHTEIENAYNQLQTFKDGGDNKVLWQSQQSLLNAYQSYHVWVSGLS
ncbi:hypothetical protein [Ferdinandcohnia sp. Marseille-Q9671]